MLQTKEIIFHVRFQQEVKGLDHSTGKSLYTRVFPLTVKDSEIVE